MRNPYLLRNSPLTAVPGKCQSTFHLYDVVCSGAWTVPTHGLLHSGAFVHGYNTHSNHRSCQFFTTFRGRIRPHGLLDPLCLVIYWWTPGCSHALATVNSAAWTLVCRNCPGPLSNSTGVELLGHMEMLFCILPFLPQEDDNHTFGALAVFQAQSWDLDLQQLTRASSKSLWYMYLLTPFSRWRN